MKNSSILRLDPDEKLKLDEQGSTIPNSNLTAPKTILELPIKSYVDGLHEINRNRRDVTLVFNNQDIEFDYIKLTGLDSVTINGDPSSNNEVSSKKYVDELVRESTLLRFIQTLQNYLKVSVGNDTYNLTQ